MPPRKRAAASETPSYDGVPTVSVVVDSEPAPAEPDPVAELAVVEVQADDTTAEPAADEQGEE